MIKGLDEYLAKVKALTGNKIKCKSPIVRALYEDKSIQAGHWLTLNEFEELI